MTETIGFQLSDISRMLRRRFDERARLIGVTRTQWRALKILSRNEGLNQGGLAELLEVEPITLCRMIDRLEDAGLVERRRDPDDRRAWRIFLTEKARPLLEQLHRIGEEVLELALQGIDQSSLDAMQATLLRIRENISTNNEGKVAHG